MPNIKVIETVNTNILRRAPEHDYFCEEMQKMRYAITYNFSGNGQKDEIDVHDVEYDYFDTKEEAEEFAKYHILFPLDNNVKLPFDLAVALENTKHIGSDVIGTAEIDVYECKGCGYHQGFDGSYLADVGDLMIECPNCGEYITSVDINNKNTIPCEAITVDVPAP